MTPSLPALKLAYLVSQYPALSHSFIETEIEGLRKQGAEVHTFSVRPSRPGDLLTERAQREAADTTVLLHSPIPVLLRAAGALLRRSASALPRTLLKALRTGPPNARARVWQVFYLLEAVLLWSHMSRLGLRHVHVHFANNGADIARLTVAIGAAVDGPDEGWRWSLTMHGPTEFEDQAGFDLGPKVASASVTACISDFCRGQLMRLLAPTEWQRLSVVRMSVDTDRFSPAPTETHAHNTAPLRILTVGRLVPEKGAPVLLEAVALLVGSGTPASLTVVGAGPLADHLAAQARMLGIEGAVELVGPVGHEHLPEVYRNADVFCLPSFAEGLPVVLMEAMATGLPVVTTTIAGIPELVVDHQTGLLVPPGRPDLLAQALAELAQPDLAKSLGEAARKAVRTLHDPADNAARLVELLRRTTS